LRHGPQRVGDPGRGAHDEVGDGMGRGSTRNSHPPPLREGGRNPTVAVFNSSQDTVELLRTALEAEGFQTVVGHIPDVKKGELDLVGFINHHAPAVVVYDISPPTMRTGGSCGSCAAPSRCSGASSCSPRPTSRRSSSWSATPRRSRSSASRTTSAG